MSPKVTTHEGLGLQRDSCQRRWNVSERSQQKVITVTGRVPCEGGCGFLPSSLPSLPGYHEMSNSLHQTFSSKYPTSQPAQSSHGPTSCGQRSAEPSWNKPSSLCVDYLRFQCFACLLCEWWADRSTRAPWDLQGQFLGIINHILLDVIRKKLLTFDFFKAYDKPWKATTQDLVKSS